MAKRHVRKVHTRSKKPMDFAKAVIRPANNKNRDWRFKQINAYKVKPEPFPRVLYTRCKFAEAGLLTVSIADQAAARTFRASSIYDPVYAVGGTTVSGHAQLAALYDQYIVTGCKVYLSFQAPTATSARVGYRLRINGNSATSSQGLSTLASQPMTYMSGLNPSGSSVKNFSFFVRPWTLMGISKLEYMANSSAYSSAISGNPSNVDNALFDIFCADPDTANSVRYLVRIVYYVQLFSRKRLTMT